MAGRSRTKASMTNNAATGWYRTPTSDTQKVTDEGIRD